MLKIYTTEAHKFGKYPMFVTCYTTNYGVTYQVFDNNKDACDFSRRLSERGYKYSFKWNIPIERIEMLKESFKK